MLNALAQQRDDERAAAAGGRSDEAALSNLAPNTPAEARSNAEWLAEIERRARATDAERPGIPWETARAEVLRRLHRG